VSARSFADVIEGEDLLSLERFVTREDVKSYADAGGDQNPLHQDDAFARSVGFDGIIAHGMFTMGHLATCVTAWAGDAGAVRRLKVQFRAPVFMGEILVAGGRVRSLDVATRTAIVDLWVRIERDDVTEQPIKRGEATVQLG